jgi:hypothetical protein
MHDHPTTATLKNKRALKCMHPLYTTSSRDASAANVTSTGYLCPFRPYVVTPHSHPNTPSAPPCFTGEGRNKGHSAQGLQYKSQSTSPHPPPAPHCPVCVHVEPTVLRTRRSSGTPPPARPGRSRSRRSRTYRRSATRSSGRLWKRGGVRAQATEQSQCTYRRFNNDKGGVFPHCHTPR